MSAVRSDITFTSRGVRCAAWQVQATSDELIRDGRRPCAVIAHGFGATRDTALMGFAEEFADAGIDSFVFDYRTFGASAGTPRQVVSCRMQRQDYCIPLAAQPGSVAVLATPAALEGCQAIGGPTWRNEVCARTSLEVAFNRPITRAAQVTCPMLVQIGSDDRVAPPDAARTAARRAGGPITVLEYPVDHFDVYAGPWQAKTLADEVDFLVKTIA